MMRTDLWTRQPKKRRDILLVPQMARRASFLKIAVLRSSKNEWKSILGESAFATSSGSIKIHLSCLVEISYASCAHSW
jgi:hypothetical protein